MTSPSVTLTLPLVSIVLVILHSSTELCATKKRKTTIRYSVVLNLKKLYVYWNWYTSRLLIQKQNWCIDMYIHACTWMVRILRDFPRDPNNHFVDILNFFLVSVDHIIIFLCHKLCPFSVSEGLWYSTSAGGWQQTQNKGLYTDAFWWSLWHLMKLPSLFVYKSLLNFNFLCRSWSTEVCCTSPRKITPMPCMTSRWLLNWTHKTTGFSTP